RLCGGAGVTVGMRKTPAGRNDVGRSRQPAKPCAVRLAPGGHPMRYLAPLLLIAAVAAPIAAAPKPANVIAKAVANPARPADHREADPLRKPAETLAFSGVRPGMTVGEFYPRGGYFTRMISYVVGPKGHVYGIENPVWKGATKADKELLAEKKWKNVSIDFQPFGTANFPKPLDLAWVTQNYHDMKIA